MRLRCGHCHRLLRLAYLTGSEWEVQILPGGHIHNRQLNGIIREDQRLQFTCTHRNGKTRTIPLRHDTLQRLCWQAVTSRRAEVLL